MLLLPPLQFHYFIIDIEYESLYRARHTCWLQEPSLHWGFLLPVGLLLIFNLVVFAVLVKKVVCHKREV